jgi:hypothetical protein
MIENRNFENKGSIAEEASELDWKARHILIPDNAQNNLVAEYTLYPSNYSFGCLKIVPRSQEVHLRSDRKDVIDLAYPRQFKSYDKLGCRLLLSTLKYILFGSSSCRMTRERCEAFFENDDKFVSRTT